MVLEPQIVLAPENKSPDFEWRTSARMDILVWRRCWRGRLKTRIGKSSKGRVNEENKHVEKVA